MHKRTTSGPHHRSVFHSLSSRSSHHTEAFWKLATRSIRATICVTVFIINLPIVRFRDSSISPYPSYQIGLGKRSLDELTFIMEIQHGHPVYMFPELAYTCLSPIVQTYGESKETDNSINIINLVPSSNMSRLTVAFVLANLSGGAG